jgi:hypothetical protein
MGQALSPAQRFTPLYACLTELAPFFSVHAAE